MAKENLTPHVMCTWEKAGGTKGTMSHHQPPLCLVIQAFLPKTQALPPGAQGPGTAAAMCSQKCQQWATLNAPFKLCLRTQFRKWMLVLLPPGSLNLGGSAKALGSEKHVIRHYISDGQQRLEAPV